MFEEATANELSNMTAEELLQEWERARRAIDKMKAQAKELAEYYKLLESYMVGIARNGQLSLEDAMYTENADGKTAVAVTQ